jgi:polyhydroxybutyrate depolymerase
MRAILAALALAAGPDPERLEWKIGEATREGLVYAPSKESPDGAPVVFGFHGHGGTMAHAARSFGIQDRWPEAVVVYLQGLPTPGRLSDPEGKRPGWQHGQGEQGDRDLKLFDEALSTLRKKFKIDEKRVYATGHSNGGQFTYLLAGARRDALAAVAPSAAAGARLMKDAAPCPLLHLAGQKDPLVAFAVQERSIAAVRAQNGCEEQGKDWGPTGCTIWVSPKDAPVVAFIHPGDHKYPAEGPELIVRFFKEHARKP